MKYKYDPIGYLFVNNNDIFSAESCIKMSIILVSNKFLMFFGLSKHKEFLELP